MIVFRPAFLAGATRAESRPGETITGYDVHICSFVSLPCVSVCSAITGLVSKFYSGVEIQVGFGVPPTCIVPRLKRDGLVDHDFGESNAHCGNARVCWVTQQC